MVEILNPKVIISLKEGGWLAKKGLSVSMAGRVKVLRYFRVQAVKAESSCPNGQVILCL